MDTIEECMGRFLCDGCLGFKSFEETHIHSDIMKWISGTDNSKRMVISRKDYRDLMLDHIMSSDDSK